MSTPVRILMCSQFPLDASLGGPKGYIEVAESYRYRGHYVDLVGINEIAGDDKPFKDELWRIKNFPLFLKNYILQNAHKYDVIEYEAIYLPFNLKNQVSAILVARSVLLEAHLKKIPIPIFPGLKAYIAHITKSWVRNYQLNKRIQQSLEGMKFATIVNVSNPSDKEILIENGIDPNKIIIQPYGLTLARQEAFKSARKEHTDENIYIAFVGSFDKRKGAVEFPHIIRSITKKFPQVKFKLFGVLGMFPTAQSIYNYLGEDLKSKVLIQERYQPKDLPNLLSDCTLGIFPSHLESFGFGVLEMMAMGIPVVGYNSPGLSMLIPKELLVERGNAKLLIERISDLINNPEKIKTLKMKCLDQTDNFIYETQENHSIKAYLELRERAKKL